MAVPIRNSFQSQNAFSFYRHIHESGSAFTPKPKHFFHFTATYMSLVLLLHRSQNTFSFYRHIHMSLVLLLHRRDQNLTPQFLFYVCFTTKPHFSISLPHIYLKSLVLLLHRHDRNTLDCLVVVPLRSHEGSCLSQPNLIFALRRSNTDFSQFCGLTTDNCNYERTMKFSYHALLMAIAPTLSMHKYVAAVDATLHHPSASKLSTEEKKRFLQQV